MENMNTYKLHQTGPETQTILDKVNENTTDIAQLQDLYQAFIGSGVTIIQPTDTWPVANPEEKVIYRVIDRVNTPPESYSDYMWNGTEFIQMATYDNAIDNVPTYNSNNLVKSGGVFNELALGSVFDVTAHNSNATFASLEALLTDANLSTLIPTSVRKGGMSIKFVQSSDNKYLQFRLMAQSFTTDVTKWSFCGENVLMENPEYIEAKTDADGKLLEGINKDGSKFFESDVEFHGKIDICGEQFYTIRNQEWALLWLNSSDKIIFGVKNNGKVYVESLDVVYRIKSNEKAVRYIEDTIGIENVDWGSLTIFDDIDSPEFISIEMDNDGNVFGGRRKDGTKIENATAEFRKVLINGKDLESELNKKADKEEDVTSNSVYRMNPDVHKIVVAATSAKYNYPVNPNKAMPAFILMADIHADWNCFERALQYADDEDYVNGVLVLGDMCTRAYQLRDYDYIVTTNLCSKPVLSVEGNHEMIVGDDPLTQDELMDLIYTSNATAHNGDIHPTGKPWWYKDITHSYERSDYYGGIRETVTNTIRVIGLQQLCYNTATQKNEWYISQEEIDWFVDTLENAPQGAYILILCHAMLEADENLTLVDCKFSADKGVYARHDVFTTPDFLTNIIRAWMNGGNINASTTSVKGNLTISVNHTFTAHPNRPVVFLSGHIHRDIVQRVNGDEPIYNVCLHCTSSQLTQQFGDLGREYEDGKKDKDCLTVFVLDYIYNRIKLIRVGADTTIDMKKRDFDTISLI